MIGQFKVCKPRISNSALAGQQSIAQRCQTWRILASRHRFDVFQPDKNRNKRSQWDFRLCRTRFDSSTAAFHTLPRIPVVQESTLPQRHHATRNYCSLPPPIGDSSPDSGMNRKNPTRARPNTSSPVRIAPPAVDIAAGAGKSCLLCCSRPCPNNNNDKPNLTRKADY